MRRSSPGFSLLEVMVALTITALVLGLVSVSLAAAFRANERARERLAMRQTMNETLARMRVLIQSAYLSPHLHNIELGHTVSETMDDSTMSEPYDALTLTTLAHSTHAIDAKEADMMEITFFTEDEPPLETSEGEERLRRLRIRVGGDINDRFEVEGGRVYTLADHVTRLEFEYLTPYEDKEWRDEWIPMEHEFDLPCMVRLTLGMRSKNYAEEVATIIIPLEMSRGNCRYDDEKIFEE